MKQKMIISNIRIPESDWLQIKAIAGDLGMSVNQYINYSIERFTLMRELAKESRQKGERRDPIWDLPKMARGIKMEPLGLSKEDEEIYGI